MRKKIFLSILLIPGTGAILFFLLLKHDLLSINPVKRVVSLDYPLSVITDDNRNMYIIDQSRRRVIKSTPDGTALFIIPGGQRDYGTFFYAQEVAVDRNDYIYILNQVLDRSGFFMEREEILRYNSSGCFDKRMFVRSYTREDHSSTLVQRGHLSSLHAYRDRLFVFEVTSQGITLHEISSSGHVTSSNHILSLPSADLLIAGICRYDDRSIIYSTKKGCIKKAFLNGKESLLYRADVKKDFSIPWWVGAIPGGDVFFTDLGSGCIKTLSGGSARTIFPSDTNSYEKPGTGHPVLYTLSINSQGLISTCDDNSIYVIHPGNGVLKTYSLLKPSLFFRLKYAIAWILFCTGIIFSLLILWLIHVHLMDRQIPDILIRAIGIIITIGLSATMISSMIVESFSSRYHREALNKTAQIVQMACRMIDPAQIERILNHDDYMNSDYMSIRATILSALNNNRDPWNDNTYFVLYRVINGTLYGLMYLNGEIGIYHPFPYFNTPDSVYRKAFFEDQIITKDDSDRWGSWQYAVGPIKSSSGETIALLEIGSDLYSYTQENKNLIRQIILDVATLLVIFILLMIEITYLMDMLKRQELYMSLRRDGRKILRQSDKYSDVFLVRFLAFIFYFSIFMSITFIPIMMKEFYKPIPGFSEKIIIGLPISCEMFCFGLSTMVAGNLGTRWGWRKLAKTGYSSTFAGLIISALAWDMWTFVFARCLTGFGSGFLLLSLRSLINMEADDEIRSEAFSHLYSAATVGLSAGAVSGAMLAEKVNYQTVFIVACIILLIAPLFIRKKLDHINLIQYAPPITIPKNGSNHLLTNGGIISFFLFMIFPTYIAGSFLTFFFPLFAKESGVSTADIGRLFVLNGLFIIYLGPILSGYLNRLMGYRRVMIMGSFMWATSLTFFAMTGSMAGAIVTLISMGIVEGFCVNAQNGFYMNLPATRDLGQDRAAGFYELAAKFGETMSPMVFASALSLGPSGGIFSLSGGILLATATYMVINRKKNNGEDK